MDELNAFPTGEPDESQTVCENAKWVFCGGRKGVDFSSGCGDGWLKAAPRLGQHQRPRAGFDKRGNDLDDRLLRPTGIEFGDDLKYCGSAVRHARSHRDIKRAFIG
jgi:hypothetical protein